MIQEAVPQLANVPGKRPGAYTTYRWGARYKAYTFGRSSDGKSFVATVDVVNGNVEAP